MITIFLNGGLGNQLFQIFNLISYSLENKVKFILQYSEYIQHGTSIKRYTYWNSFLKNLKPFTVKQLPRLNIIKEKNFSYNKLPKELDNIMFIGYFQSYKYFENQYDNIIKFINLRNQQNIIRQKYNHYLDNVTVSMHFRIGDYKYIQNCYPLMTLKYYKKCLQKIIDLLNTDNINVIYFCQEENIEEVNEKISILKNDFQNTNFIKASNVMEDWEQLLLMSCCNHNIIANSSYSWWGAYFNENKNKIVCYPSLWFGEKLNYNKTDDLCPNDWIKV